jgi:hypothetical protein
MTRSQKIRRSPTEKEVGLSPTTPTGPLTAKGQLAKIDHACYNQRHRQGGKHPNNNQEQPDLHVSREHKTLVQKLKRLLFYNPTDENLGLMPPKQQLTKAEALHKIDYACHHPFHPQEGQQGTPKHHDHHEHKEHHEHRTLGQKIKDVLTYNPTDENLGLLPLKGHLSKAEAMQQIEYAWTHPFAPNCNKR